MTAEREAILDKLLNAYFSSHDIERTGEGEEPLKAVCHFYAHNSQYVISKKAELWSADTTEHIYIFSVPELTADLYRSLEQLAYDRGMSLIDPKPGHMCTYITAVIICGSCTDEAAKLIRKCRLYKSFHFSLHGWMDFHSVCVTADTSSVIHNRSGHTTAEFMKKILYNSKKGRKRL